MHFFFSCLAAVVVASCSCRGNAGFLVTIDETRKAKLTQGFHSNQVAESSLTLASRPAISSRQIAEDSQMAEILTFVSAKIPVLQRALTEKLAAIALLDITNPDKLLMASKNIDKEFACGSIAKLALLLSGFYYFNLAQGAESQKNAIFLWEKDFLKMMRDSDNDAADRFYSLYGFSSIQQIMTTLGLYNETEGGLWMGNIRNQKIITDFQVSLNITERERISWERQSYSSPRSQANLAATARALVDSLLWMEQGRLFNFESSRAMKGFLKKPTTSKWARAFQPGEVIWYGKTGTLGKARGEMSLFESPLGYRFILVLLTAYTDVDDDYPLVASFIHRKIRESHLKSGQL